MSGSDSLNDDVTDRLNDVVQERDTLQQKWCTTLFDYDLHSVFINPFDTNYCHISTSIKHPVSVICNF